MLTIFIRHLLSARETEELVPRKEKIRPWLSSISTRTEDVEAALSVSMGQGGQDGVTVFCHDNFQENYKGQRMIQ